MKERLQSTERMIRNFELYVTPTVTTVNQSKDEIKSVKKYIEKLESENKELKERLERWSE